MVIGGSGRNFFHPLEGNTYQGSLKRYMLPIVWLYTTYHLCTRTSHHPFNMGPTPWKIKHDEPTNHHLFFSKERDLKTRPPWGLWNPAVHPTCPQSWHFFTTFSGRLEDLSDWWRGSVTPEAWQHWNWLVDLVDMCKEGLCQCLWLQTSHFCS